MKDDGCSWHPDTVQNCQTLDGCPVALRAQSESSYFFHEQPFVIFNTPRGPGRFPLAYSVEFALCQVTSFSYLLDEPSDFVLPSIFVPTRPMLDMQSRSNLISGSLIFMELSPNLEFREDKQNAASSFFPDNFR